jgi:predicted murein hydrolase (TIGR00659 family)
MQTFVSSPYFGIILSIIAFELGVWLNRKTHSSLANPLLIAIVIVITVLQLFGIPLDSYNKGGDIIALFLAPATASLSISIYKNRELLKTNLIPIIIGTAVGSAVSVGSVIIFSRLFHLDSIIEKSLIPKSVTTPIAMQISDSIGGISAITVAVVVITGIVGSILAPILISLFRIKNSVAVGVAIGTCSHAVGTSKAMELGEVEGAMSSISIGIAGLITVLYSLFFI